MVVVKRSLVDEMRVALADDILAGHIQPGQRLDEKSLAQRFNASRTPVREALKQLAATALAEHIPRRGVFVAAVPEERLGQMFELAADLESLCARYAAVRMTPADRRTLLALHHHCRDMVARGESADYDGANREFHHVILHASGNDYLIEATIAARIRVQPYRRAQFKLEGRLEQSLVEHAEVIAALMASDGEEAQRRMRRHLRASQIAAGLYLATVPGLQAVSSESPMAINEGAVERDPSLR